MSKKSLLVLAVTLSMVAILAIGGTLAYFTDTTDVATNVFTVGDVEIELIEEFDPNNAVLMPGSKTTNAINKDVWVENTGASDAWVRVKLYVPSHLDQLTTPDYTDEGYLVAAAFNTLHWNTVGANSAIWNVEKANVEATAITTGEYAGYNEYVFYYNEILGVGEKTEQLLDQVYLDSKVDFDGTNYTINGQTVDLSKIDIKIFAEAIQSEGFDTYEAAFAAFDAQN